MRSELIEAVELLRSPGIESMDRALLLLQATVFSFSMKVCGHREDAEDTTQDVLLKSIPYLRRIESPQALSVWLYRVTQRRCWMSRRRSTFAPQRTLSLAELMPDSHELDALVSRGARSPEQSAITHQGSDQVREAVLLLPAKYRLILVLHDMEDLSNAEVAKITGLQEGTVRVRLHRARLLVRGVLSGVGDLRRSRSRVKKTRPTDCQRVFAGLSDYIDEVTDDETSKRFRTHIRNCLPCVRFLEDLSRAVERCRAVEVGCDPETASTIRKLLLQEYYRVAGNERDKFSTA